MFGSYIVSLPFKAALWPKYYPISSTITAYFDPDPKILRNGSHFMVAPSPIKEIPNASSSLIRY